MTSVPETGRSAADPTDVASLYVGDGRSTVWRALGIGIVAIAAAIGASYADSAPTGHESIDQVERMLVAALITVAGAGSRRPQLIVFVTLPTMLSSTPWLFAGVAAILLVLAEIAMRRRPEPLVGAVAAGLAVQVAFRLGHVGFTGFTALIGVGAGVLLIVSAIGEQPDRVRRVLWSVAGGFGAVVAIIAGFAIFGGASAVSTIDDAIDVSKEGLRLAREGDIDGARPMLEDAGDALGRAGDDFDGWWTTPTRAIPVLAQHQEAAVELTAAGAELTGLAGDVTSLINSDALRGQDGRIDLDQIRALEEPTRRAEASVDRTLEIATSLRSPWLIGPVDDRIESLERRLVDIAPSTALAAEVVEVLPALLGGDDQRNYFLMLLTPSETRELGGISGSWAEFRVDDGQIDLVDRGRSEDLDQDDVRLDESYPISYRESLPGPHPQNYSSTPDMAVAARGAAELYESATGTEIHGVIAVDTDALVGVIKLTGPITVPGYSLTLDRENAREFLLYDQYEVFPDRDERGEYLNQLIDTAFTKLTSGSLPDPSDLIAVFGPLVERDRVRILTFEEDETALFEELGLDGRLAVDEGDDVLGVFHSNRGQNKLDAYLERTVDYDVEIDWDERTVTADLTVELSSEAPTEDWPDIVIRNEGHPYGTNSTNLFVLTPLEVEAMRVDGEDRTWTVQTEGSLNRRGLPVDIPPGETVTVEITLSGPLELESGYGLKILHQPLVIDDRLTVSVADTDGTAWVATDEVGTWIPSDVPFRVESTTNTVFLADE